MNEQDLINMYADYITSIIEIELKTAGYTISNTSVSQINIIEDRESDDDSINSKTIQIVYEMKLDFADISLENLDHSPPTETQTSEVIVSVTDANSVEIKYDENITFPDTQYESIVSKHTNSEINTTQTNENTSHLTITEINTILKQLSHTDLPSELKYYEYGVTSPLFTQP